MILIYMICCRGITFSSICAFDQTALMSTLHGRPELKVH